MTVAVEPATADQTPALLDLWEEAWAAAMPTIDFRTRRPWFVDHLARLQAEGAQLLVAADGGEILGFVTVDAATGALDQLVVAIAHQGRGIGGRLIDSAKRRSPGGLHLTVNTVNARAVALYRRHGFVTIGDGVNARSGLPVLDMRWTP